MVFKTEQYHWCHMKRSNQKIEYASKTLMAEGGKKTLLCIVTEKWKELFFTVKSM